MITYDIVSEDDEEDLVAEFSFREVIFATLRKTPDGERLRVFTDIGVHSLDLELSDLLTAVANAKADLGW